MRGEDIEKKGHLERNILRGEMLGFERGRIGRGRH